MTDASPRQWKRQRLNYLILDQYGHYDQLRNVLILCEQEKEMLALLVMRAYQSNCFVYLKGFMTYYTYYVTTWFGDLSFTLRK